MASPSILAMLLTTKYVDGLPLHRFEKILGRHGVDIPRQTLARWVIQCGEHLQPLLNLMEVSTKTARRAASARRPYCGANQRYALVLGRL